MKKSNSVFNNQPPKQVEVIPKENDVAPRKKKSYSSKRKLTSVEATQSFQKKNVDFNKMIKTRPEIRPKPQYMIQDPTPSVTSDSTVSNSVQPFSVSSVDMVSSNFDSRTLYRLTLISEAIDDPFTELSLGNLLENYRFASSVVGFNITHYGHRFEVSLSNFTVYGELIMHGLPDVRHDKIIKFHPLQSLFDIRLSNVPIGATADMIKQLLRNEGCSLVNDYTIRNEAHVTVSKKSFKTGRWRVLCFPTEGLHLPADNNHCTFFPDRVVVISCSKRPPASFPLPRQQSLTLPSTTIKMTAVTNKTTTVINKTSIVTNKTPSITNKTPPVTNKLPVVTATPPLSIHLPVARTLVATITPCTSLVASLCAVPSNSKQHSFIHDRQVSTRSQSDLSAARLVASLSVMSDRYSSGSGLVPRVSAGSELVPRAKIIPSTRMSSLPAKTSVLSAISTVSASTNVSSLLEPPSRKKVKLSNTVNLPTTRSIQAKGDDPLEAQSKIHFMVSPQNDFVGKENPPPSNLPDSSACVTTTAKSLNSMVSKTVVTSIVTAAPTAPSKALEVKESFPSNDLLLLSDCILMKEKCLSDKSSDSLETRDGKDVNADQAHSAVPGINGIEISSPADTPLVSSISLVSFTVSQPSDTKVVQTLENPTSDCSLSSKSPVIEQNDISLSDDAMVSSSCTSGKSTTIENTEADPKTVINVTTSNTTSIVPTVSTKENENAPSSNSKLPDSPNETCNPSMDKPLVNPGDENSSNPAQ